MMVWIIITLLLVSSVLGLGIAPSRKMLDYEAGSQTYTARILNDEHKALKMLVFAKGEYAGMVTIDNNMLNIKADEAEKSFTYTIKMPEKMRPGANKIEIVAMQLPDEFNQQVVVVDGEVIPVGEQKATLISALSLIHQVIINVPYPGLFAEGKLYVSAGGVGEDTTFAISVFNRGNQEINATGYVVVKGPTNEEIARVKTNDAQVKAGEVGKLVAGWKADANPGKYLAEAVVTYNGNTIELSQAFEIGELFIEIDGIKVKSFTLGSIAKFDISLLSKWNQPIQNVYGTLQVMDSKNSLLSEIKTDSISLPPRGEGMISGYWDTEGASIGEYDVNVMLNYEGKTSQKMFETVVSADSIEFKGTALAGQVVSTKEAGKYNLLIILVVILIFVNIALFIYFRRKGGGKGRNDGPPVQQTIREKINQ